MKLTWLGHACFLLEEEGFRLVLDPYTRVEGYPELSVEAHGILCSHGHHDHCAKEQVKLLPERESPFTVRTVAACHDPQGGALRGSNTIHVISAGGITLAHLGDLGHQLSPEQLSAIGPLDGVLVPVGGFYTIDAREAREVCAALAPKWMIPMHYHHAPYGLPVVGELEPFLEQFSQVTRLEGSSLELTGELSGVIVPQYLPCVQI